MSSKRLILRSAEFLLVFRWMILGSIWLVAALQWHPAYADVTQAAPNLIPCNAQQLAIQKRLGNVGPIPGKMGETGYVTLSPYYDLQGNSIAVYCLEKNANHGGPDQAALYTPAPVKGVPQPGVWVGACTLATGQNVFTFTGDKIVKGANGASIINQFTGFSWSNYENITPADQRKLKTGGPGTKTGATYNNYEYQYTVKGNKLAITQTTSYYQQQKVPGVTLPDGSPATVDTLQLDKATPDPKGPIMAPTNFTGLTFNGNQIAALGTNGSPGIGRQSLSLASLTPPAPGQEEYALLSDALYGNGSATNPFVGLTVPITAGDMLTIGVGAVAASVTGSAATADYGAWTLLGTTGFSTTFEATADAELLGGELLSGFDIEPITIEHSTPWIYAGADPLANSAGYLFVPEPPSFSILALGIGLLGSLRRLSRFSASLRRRRVTQIDAGSNSNDRSCCTAFT